MHRLFRIALLTALMFPAVAALSQEQAAVPPGRVVITGTVPDEATKAALLARLQEVYGTGQVVDQLSVGGVAAPPNWSSQVPRLISQNLKSIHKGQLVIDGTSVAVRGEVASDTVRQSVATDFASALSPSYVVKNGLRVSAATQALLDRTLADRVIEFERGSALLADSGKAILDEMADTLKKTHPAKLEVIGHTDDLGAPARNLALSRARADSVKTYLVAKGLAPEMIGTSGMGSDQPIVPNTSNEGRRRNRRIEFRVSQ